MRRCSTALILLCYGLLSGCDLLLVAAADAATPDPVQSVDVTWASSPNLCAQMIHREHRTAFLMQGNLDAPGYEPVVVPQLYGSNMAIAASVRKNDLLYVYSESVAIDFDQTASLPPMPGAEDEDFTGAIRQAWRTFLYREHSDGTRSPECTFVTRFMWFNLAI